MSHTHFFLGKHENARTHYTHMKSVLMVYTVDQGKPTRVCNNDSAWRQNLLLCGCFHQARLEKWVVSDGWYREWERASLWLDRKRVSLSLSLWLAHTHTPQHCNSILLSLIETMADGVQQIGRQNGADPKLAFSLSPIKILIFSLGSSRWSGASVFCWDDEGFGKTAKRSMSTWSHWSSSQNPYLPLFRKWKEKQWNEEVNDSIVSVPILLFYFLFSNLPSCVSLSRFTDWLRMNAFMYLMILGCFSSGVFSQRNKKVILNILLMQDSLFCWHFCQTQLK